MKRLVLRRAAVLLFAGCAAVGIAVPSAAQSTITPTAKDLNKSFDADSTEWVERFEHEDGRSTTTAPRSSAIWVSSPG